MSEITFNLKDSDILWFALYCTLWSLGRLYCSEEGNRGNVHALLILHVDAGDDVLKNHLERCGKNAIYISKTVQNELISKVGGAIKEAIIREELVNKVFSVITNEATESSMKEWLPLVIHFVDSKNNIRKAFVGFQE